MKRAACIILCLILLTGCASGLPEASQITSGIPSETAATVPPQTAPTTAPTEATIPETQSVIAETEPPVLRFDPNTVLQTMTLEEKVGQLFLAACPDSNAIVDIQNYHPGGYLLFGKDFSGQTPASLIETVAAYQKASRIPMLIAVDEEGGTVCRVSANPAFRESRFPSPRTLYHRGGMDLVIATEKEKCQLLSSLGINVNLAPVCDVTTDPSAFMYKRSLGESPEITGKFTAAVVQTMTSYQIGSVLKHFPGYGNNTDTHTGIAVDHRDLQDLMRNDLVPFSAGIEANCGAILVSHTFVECLDGEYPASLSPAVHTFLREEMGFEGVIITDDLTMDAITDLYGSGQAAVLAVLAGNDLICTFDYPIQFKAVLEAVQNGHIPLEQIDQAICRILQWKYDLDILDNLTNYT